MSERLKFDKVRAKSARTKLVRRSGEMEGVYKILCFVLNEQSTSWWVGNSKNGYTKSVERLLSELKSATQTIEMLGNDLLEIIKKKEEEENELKKQLADTRPMAVAQLESEQL